MEKNKKPFYKKWWFWLIIVVVAGVFGSAEESNEKASQNKAEVVEGEKQNKEAREQKNEPKSDSKVDDAEVENAGYTIKFGELLDVTENEMNNVAVFKTKIEPSFTNDKTIKQNYHNVEDLIRNQGADKFDEIQYWAVADMTDGSESKVIAFTLNKQTIEGIANENIHAIELGDYVDDLWILPSLKN